MHLRSLRRVPVYFIAWGLLLNLGSGAHAEETKEGASENVLPSPSLQEADFVSPDTPTVEAGWRGGTRAKLAYPIPLWRRNETWRLRLPVLIELHNLDSRSPFPHEFWRARIAAEAIHGRRFSFPGADLSLNLHALIEHESDHETSNLVYAEESTRGEGFEASARYRSALWINALALRSQGYLRLRRVEMAAGATLRLHFLSCTDAAAVGVCDYRDGRGGQGVDLEFDATLRGNEGLWSYFFLSFHAHHARGGAQILLERRILLYGGLRLPTASYGTWQLAGVLLAGNDTGLLRDRRVLQAGALVRWAWWP